MAVVRIVEPSGRCVEYERRQPEKTVFYRIVQEHIETLFAEAEQNGSGYPEHVKHEFERFLNCGILSAMLRQDSVLTARVHVRAAGRL